MIIDPASGICIICSRQDFDLSSTFMSKSEKYAKGSKDTQDDLEALSAKLAAELRGHIRELESHPILSEEWVRMAYVCGRIANISDVESRLPGSKDEATLWETEEQALRYLLEDGKLNLCLRTLIEFKTDQRPARDSKSGPIYDESEVCDKFEKGIGVVLRNAWAHVEVLQTTDLTGLINHISDVLEDAIRRPELLAEYHRNLDLQQRQEVMVVYYLNSIAKNLENIHEDRVMPLIRERRLFQTLLRYFECYQDLLTSGSFITLIHTISLLCDSEDFSTYFKERYLPTLEDAQSFVLMKSLIESRIREISYPINTIGFPIPPAASSSSSSSSASSRSSSASSSSSSSSSSASSTFFSEMELKRALKPLFDAMSKASRQYRISSVSTSSSFRK